MTIPGSLWKFDYNSPSVFADEEKLEYNRWMLSINDKQFVLILQPLFDRQMCKVVILPDMIVGVMHVSWFCYTNVKNNVAVRVA